MQIKRNTKGFTLLEILLVIAAIGILAAIVLVAINPNRQLAQARDTARQSDINTLQKALDQYLIDTRAYPVSVSSTSGYICNTGVEQVGGGTNCSGRIDLRVLVPTYIAGIPRDTQATGTSTGYNVVINPNNNKISVSADLAERKLISINPYVVTSGLVLNLDAGNTTSYPGTGTIWTDLSGNGNNGTLTNGPTYNSLNGGSIVFDGVDDRVTIPNNASLNITSFITLSSWFKLNSTVTSEMAFLRKEAQWQLGLINTTMIRCLLSTTGGITGWTAANDTVYPFALGNWYNMVMTYDGNTMSIFVNNILVRTATVTGTIGVTTNGVQIGNWTVFLNGNIANTSIYNRALSATEIQQNYNALRGRYGL